MCYNQTIVQSHIFESLDTRLSIDEDASAAYFVRFFFGSSNVIPKGNAGKSPGFRPPERREPGLEQSRVVTFNRRQPSRWLRITLYDERSSGDPVADALLYL